MSVNTAGLPPASHDAVPAPKTVPPTVPTTTTTTAATKSTAAEPVPGPQPPAPVGAASDPAAQMIVSQTVTQISPPGFTQTVTTHANGVVTTVITNEVGSVVKTSTAHTAEVGSAAGVAASAVDLWA